MEWISIENRDQLPKDNVFLALWKGAFCIVEYKEDDDHFYMGMMPACYTGFMKVDHEREGKFTHYCDLKYPPDY